MTDLSGLELRKKALPMLGWRLFFVGNGFLYHEVIPPQEPTFQLEEDQKRLWEEVPFAQIGDTDLQQCPAIESDPAVSIPMLDEFCKKRGLDWTLSSFIDGTTNCALFRTVPLFGREGVRTARIVNVDGGPNPCESVARAIVAATEKP